eukprot:g10135.t1
MQWQDLEVWRRQRPYVGAELRKDAPEHLARLGLATSFVLVVGMAEGARVSALKGDVEFPIRYAIYNAIPSFVGGKVPAANVASAMASAPPLRACPRAAAHAANLRALRTAVAGYTVLSIVYQVTLAGDRGTQAYQQAVAEGYEVPSMATAALTSGSSDGSTPTSVGGVVRLCGAQGLEPALVAAAVGRGGYRTPVLPVVISSGAPAQKRHTSSISMSNEVSSDLAASSLPEGALAAISKHSPRPCYYRIDRERLFSREAWQPVAAEMAAAGARSRSRGEIVVVVEADSLSSDTPQTLLSPPVKSAAIVGSRGGDGSGNSGGLGEDQAVWALAMLRRALEEKRERESGRVASVLLAERRLVDVEGSSTVSIDARSALLLSVLSWAQQCAAEAAARGQEDLASLGLDSGAPPRGDGTAASSAEAPGAPVVPEGDSGESQTAKQLVEVQATAVETTLSADTVSDAYFSGDEPQADGNAGGETTEAGDPLAPPPASTAAKVLGVLENMGRGVRVAVAPFGQLRSTVGRSLSAVYCWVEKSRRRASVPGKRAATATSPTLFYDTDDDQSFEWLAVQMLKAGWIVKRTSSGRPQREDIVGVPVLVHHCSDEKTLTAAAGYLSPGTDINGPPVCAVVHSWDCGVEARRLLVGARAGTGAEAGGSAAPTVPVEVICTAEVGEDLFQFARWQLLSGATPEQVQKVLDDLFGALYGTGDLTSQLES